MKRPARFMGVASMAAIAALALAACSSSTPSTTSTSTPSKGSTTSTTTGVQTGGTMTMALDETIPGWNIDQLNDAEFVLQEVLDMVWPQVYIINNGLQPYLNTQLMDSVNVTSTNPLTIVYNINKNAQWSDGTPIDAADFVYNYEAQSGNTKWLDYGKQAFEAASTTGYNQIKSVTGSNPPSGACTNVAMGTDTTLPAAVCGNGKTVTVVFNKPFADWKALFSDLVPEHIATTATGGFNSAFNNVNNVISGSWYTITKYTTNSSIVLSRNPKYWSTPGKLDHIVFDILSSDANEVPDLQNGEVNLINPASVSETIIDQASSLTGATKEIIPGLEFEHFDFNEANGCLAQVAIRQAIAYGTNRKEIIARTVGEFDSAIQPLGNRMLMPNQQGYVNNGTAYENVNDAKAKQLIESTGLTMKSDGYFNGGSNCSKSNTGDLTLGISSTSGNALRADTMQLFQSMMKSIGIKITISAINASTFFGTDLPKGNFDIAEFAWVSTPFLSGNEPIYCSYTNATVCGENWDHYANSTVDSDLFNGAAATSSQEEINDFNAADAQLWADMVTLPLYQKPQYYAWTSTYGNVIPNASSSGVPWNANLWGMKTS